MKEDEFKKILDKGETDTVEFKSWVNAKNQREIVSLAVDELIAFANYKGGTVYFGVEDNPIKVTGCDMNYDSQRIIEAIFVLVSNSSKLPFFKQMPSVITAFRFHGTFSIQTSILYRL